MNFKLHNGLIKYTIFLFFLLGFQGLGLSQAQNLLMAKNGIERGGTQAGLLFKVEAARKKALEILNHVKPNDIDQGHRDIIALYTLELRQQLINELSAFDQEEGRYKTIIHIKPASEVFVIRKGQKVFTTAYTGFTPFSEIVISESFAKRSNTSALANVLLHEVVHHKGFKDEEFKNSEGDIAFLDNFALVLAKTYQKKIEKSAGEIVATSNYNAFDYLRMITQSTNYRQLLLYESMRPRLEKLKDVLLGRNKLPMHQFHTNSSLTFRCQQKDLVNLGLLTNYLLLNPKFRKESFKSKIPLDAIERMFFHYNNRIRDFCPDHVLIKCVEGKHLANSDYSIPAGIWGYFVHLQGPLNAFGIEVTQEYTGPDEGDRYSSKYIIKRAQFNNTLGCFLNELSY